MVAAAKKIAVYRITNTVSGTYYVGSSTNLYERWRTHRKKLRAGSAPNPRLQASWSKHGEAAFVFSILGEFTTVQEMEAAEEALLSEFVGTPGCCNMSRSATTPWRNKGPLHPQYGVLRTTESKEGLRKAALLQWALADPRTGLTHSAEAKAKISAKVQAALADGRGGKFIPTAETRAKMSAALMGNKGPKGHVRTEEHRRKLAESAKGNQNFRGKKHTEVAKAKLGKRVHMISPDGEITTYPRTTAIKEQHGIFLPTLLRSMRSGKPLAKGPYKGWRFEYA